MDQNFHGGSLSDAEAQFGPSPEGWVDLSTGINPNAYPNTQISVTALSRLPEFSKLEELICAAKNYYQVPPGSGIVAAPGTQALIQYLPMLRQRSRVQILSPTYTEHAKVWSECGHTVGEVCQFPEMTSADVTIVVNPNNPDGRVTSLSQLTLFASENGEEGRWLIVDEAFADVAPEMSLVTVPDLKGVVVARSFGKFFGLPGLRLGFLIGDNGIIERVENLMGIWAVSGPSIEIGIRALSDRDWIESTKSQLSRARQELEAMLKFAGFSILGGTDLYVLTEHSRASEKFEALGRAGIYVRRFPNRENWLRFGIPGNEQQFERVRKVLCR